MEVLTKRARKGGKKNRKFGRNRRRPSTFRYNLEKRWERNKIRKLRKHMKRHPKDMTAERCLKNVGS